MQRFLNLFFLGMWTMFTEHDATEMNEWMPAADWEWGKIFVCTDLSWILADIEAYIYFLANI